jgi:hypothetical protein
MRTGSHGDAYTPSKGSWNRQTITHVRSYPNAAPSKNRAWERKAVLESLPAM